jgi:hypothetical protein
MTQIWRIDDQPHFLLKSNDVASLEPSDPEDTPAAEPVQPQLHEPRPPVIRPDLNLED